jgi:outer membrane protein assembly factor BamC
MKHILTCVSVVLILNLSGCGWLGLRDRSNDYLLAEETQPTVVPSDLDSATLGQIYPIPAIPLDSVELVAYEVPRPQPASVNTFEQLVKIQTVDGRRWILINISPSEVWPRIRNILNRNGIPSARAEGSAGIIETVWVNFNSDEENGHRFRFAIASGVQIDSTEISVLHQQIAKGEEEGAAWPQTSQSPTRESDMLSLVANDLASASEYATVSLLAQDIGGEAKVEIKTPEVADPFILVKLGFDRTWASISYSADRGGFVSIDKNRSEGIMYVNYTEETTDEEGFFSRWFGGGAGEEILDINYRILVQPVGASVEVRIIGPDGEGLNKAESLRLLKVLRGNMS